MIDTLSTSLPLDIGRSLIKLLDCDALNVLWKTALNAWVCKTQTAIYEVQEHKVTLELLNTKGRKALYTKQQTVRFLQNNVIAYEDQAWGDGNIFAKYKCAPGKAVDTYKEGYRYKVLISLRETKKRGDTEDFYIERTITDGFIKSVENFQTQVNHPMRSLSISLIFPPKRLPKSVLLIEQNASRMRPLGGESINKLPDGRVNVTWHTDKPRLYESYILRWEW